MSPLAFLVFFTLGVLNTIETNDTHVIYSTNVHNLMFLSITEIRRECYAAQIIQSTDSPQVSYPNGQATPSQKRTRKRCRFVGFLLFPVYLPHRVKAKAMSLFNWVL